MKIVHLARKYYPDVGGVETHLLHINRLLQADGHKVRVITEQSDSSQKLESKHEDVQVLRISQAETSSKLGIWKSIWHLRKTLLEADIIHVHDVFWWLWPVLPLVEDKLFITFHGWEGQYPVRWQAKLQRWLASKFSQGSIHVGDWIQEFYWDKPDYVTYGGVELPAKKETSKTNANSLVFVGRLSKDNDLPIYLELVKKLPAQSKIKVIWVGDGEFRSECEQYGEAVGFVPDPSPYLQDAKIVLAASYLSILQAQALGKVVVAVYSNPLKKRYLETYPGVKGMIVGNNPEKLAAELSVLLEDTEKYSELSLAAQKYADFQPWRKVADIYTTLWQTKK